VKRHREATARQQRLDEVIAEYLEAVDAGQTLNPDEWLARFPDLAEPLANFFAEEGWVHGLLAVRGPESGISSQKPEGSTPTPPSSDFCPPTPEADAPPDFGDYELVEEIARGGMGVVYRARQKSLNRFVALKHILAGRLASAEAVRRFRYEAELAANLDHPHVVPIYEVGEHDGLPYFTMKLIEGGNLAQHAANFRGDPPAAARLVAAVARAVHHAHQHGLLHRDLKPANILLSAACGLAGPTAGPAKPQAALEPFVADFGLARRVSGGPGLTGSGAAVGTPSYMAPEQARGGAVTTAADVYSLGAILYELLAGSPPFRADHPLETLRQLQEQEPTRPRALEPKVPRDLETVCLKCLEKDPTRRYASAQELADDLDRFLRGEPIRGRRVGAAGQLWRWCRRRPLPACLAAVLVLSVVGGLALVTWQWRRAEANYHRAEEERGRALEERARADEGFREAHRAVQEFCTRASEGKLRNVPGAQAVRKELLESALAYYERFLRERGEDASLRAELAEAHLRIGIVCRVLGSNSRGVAACQQALALYRELLRDDPKNVTLRIRLGVALHVIGYFRSQTNDVAAALDSLAEARGLYEALGRERPNDPAVQGAIADVLTVTGGTQARAGKLADAIASFDQARQIQEELNRRSPGQASGKEGLADICLNLALAHRSLGNRAETARFSRQARGLLEGLVKAEPGNFHYRRQLARAYWMVAADLPPAEALPLVRHSHALLVRLCDLEPGAAILQSELAASHRLLGHIYSKTGRKVEALAEYEKALAVLEPVVRQHPQVTDFQHDLARCHFDVGFMRLELGNPAGALESMTKTHEIRRALVKANPRNATYRTDLGRILINLSAVFAALGRKREALEAARQSVEEHRTVFAQAPQVPRYRSVLAHALKSRVRFSLENGLPAEAARMALELKKLCPTDGRELYEAAKCLAHAAVSAGKKAEPSSLADAERYADLAVVTLREAIAAGLPGDARPHTYPAFTILRGRRDFQDLLAGLPQQAPSGK
jgi:serine/threonine-protein kinase